MFNINVADDWIWTVGLWCQIRPLCQLSRITENNVIGYKNFVASNIRLNFADDYEQLVRNQSQIN